MGVGIIGGSGAIDSDDLTAVAANVLFGKTYIGNDTDGETGTGTMTNNVAVSITKGAGTTYTIPQGYHNGSGKVTATTLASETPGNATAAQVLYGKTCWVNGAMVTGSMANNGAQTKTLGPSESYTIPVGYHNGSGKVTAKTLASVTSANATAAQVLSGKTCWVNGSKVTGTMTNNGAVTASLNAGKSYVIPAGYHNGSGRVTANSLASQTAATATPATIRASYTAWVGGEKVTGTGTSTGARTITPTTSNQTVTGSTFLTGNITMAGSAYLAPEYIKSGVTIFGITGTWEGLT